jgi:hypothetical protein
MPSPRKRLVLVADVAAFLGERIEQQQADLPPQPGPGVAQELGDPIGALGKLRQPHE